MATWGLEIDDGDFPRLADLPELDVNVFLANLAHVIERVLRRQKGRLWPRETGFSQNRFRVEDVAHTRDLLVLNSAPYARFVNDRESYPSGKPNPNYRAAQRTIEKHWGDIVRRALG